MDWKAIEASLIATGIAVGTKLLGAIVVFIFGRWAIGIIVRMITRVLRGYKMDETLMAYLTSIINVLLNIMLALGLLGFFGVETTSFAALLAGAGLAIGTAWGGLLGHFAAGIFMVVLRPFKVGDFITAGGVTGTVDEIGLFSTTILSPDNVVNYVGNGKIFGDNIQNYTATPHRRVDLTAQLAHSVDPHEAIKLLRAKIDKIPNVIAKPAAEVEIGSFTERGPLLVIRPYAANAHYWQVYFDTNKAIRDAFAEAGYPVPEVHAAERQIELTRASGSV